MPKVRTTMRPDVEIEVSDIEAADLARQGLLVAGVGYPSAPPSPVPVPAPGPATTKKAAPVAATKEG